MAEYLAFYDVRGTWKKPKSYQWTSEPAEQYADDGEELINGKVGDPTDPGNPAWAGNDGSIDIGVGILMDFWFPRQVDWVGFHLLADPANGIHYPNALSLSCSNGGDFHSMGTWQLPAWRQEQAGEYTLSNLTALNHECRQIKAWLTNTHWTFISEVEMVSGQSAVILPHTFDGFIPQ